VLQPVAVLLRAVTARHGGDLAARAGLKGRSEIARLGRAFDVMADAVTERSERARRAAEEADAARRRTEEILESIQDGFYALDRGWRFTYVNAAAEQLWGRSREALLGRVAWEALPEAEDAEFRRQHLLAIDAGQPRRYEARSAVTGRWTAVTLYPGPTGLSAYFRDVSARKEAEEALERSEANLRGFCESSPLPMGIAEAVGDAVRRVYDNPAAQRLLGLPEERADGGSTSEAGAPSTPIGEWVAR
jgi:PAS domain S-box-containing protein